MPTKLKLIISLIVISMTGCSGIRITSNDGTIHHFIIGIGIVSAPKNNGEYGVLATKTQALGVYLSDQPGLKLGVGYSSASTVIIPDDSENIIVEISQPPMGPLSIVANPKAEGKTNERK